MPHYDYKCPECGHTFETFHSISSAPLTVCPQCGGKIERVISGGSGFIFKGGGSYSSKDNAALTGKTRCGKESPCCGRQTPCDTPPCE